MEVEQPSIKSVRHTSTLSLDQRAISFDEPVLPPPLHGINDIESGGDRITYVSNPVILPTCNLYDNMRPWSSTEPRHDISLHSQTHISPLVACQSEQIQALDASTQAHFPSLNYMDPIDPPRERVPMMCNSPLKLLSENHLVNPSIFDMSTEVATINIGDDKGKCSKGLIFEMPKKKKSKKPIERFHYPKKHSMMRIDAPPLHVLQNTHVDCPYPTNLPQRTDEYYSIFKTSSTKLETNSTCLHSKPHEEHCIGLGSELDVMHYFNALKGPELDILKDSEDTVVPIDKKWPFLLRFPIGSFGICLGLGSQTILWKTLSSADSMEFLQISGLINLIVWCLALMTLIIVFVTYSLKCVFYFEAVRREFYHPVRINFFFAPWIACMFLALGAPPIITKLIHRKLWILFMAPIVALELKIYGQWLSGGERRLSRVANPSTHLSLVGNFVGALLATTVGWRELAIFFWSVGLVHYLVLLVTLYQRLPTAAILPKELHPVFFLFVAAPSTASVAWSKIVGEFDLVSRITYFVGLFLYSSLVVRVNLFRGLRFTIAWWAYTFPMTASAIATVHYSIKVTHPITQGLVIVLSMISSITVSSLCMLTILHMFVWCTMFPNDMAIAITSGGIKVKRRIKELQEDYIPSLASPKTIVFGQSNDGKSYTRPDDIMKTHFSSRETPIHG